MYRIASDDRLQKSLLNTLLALITSKISGGVVTNPKKAFAFLEVELYQHR